MEESPISTEADDTHTVGSSIEDDSYSENGSFGSNIVDMRLKWKKAVLTISKLRKEVVVLQEELDNAKTNDIVILQDKYRGAQVDITTLRRRNTELKGRVQTLEAKLFDAISRNNSNHQRDVTSTNTDNVAESQAGLTNDSRFQDADDDIERVKQVSKQDGMTKGARNIASKAVKYGNNKRFSQEKQEKQPPIAFGEMEIEKMKQQYEGRIRELEEMLKQSKTGEEETKRIDSVSVIPKANDKENNSNSSVAMDANEGVSAYTPTPFLDDTFTSLETLLSRGDRKKIESSVTTYLQSAMEIDRKTMRELSKEVKRLSAQLGEDDLDLKEEDTVDNDYDDRDGNNAMEDIDFAEAIENQNEDNDPPGESLLSDEQQETLNNLQKKPRNRRKTAKEGVQYNLKHILLSVIFGVFISVVLPVLKQKEMMKTFYNTAMSLISRSVSEDDKMAEEGYIQGNLQQNI
jgi:hypothetical protein